MVYTAENAWSTFSTLVTSFLQEEKMKNARAESIRSFFIKVFF
jgi:hypothetical protein